MSPSDSGRRLVIRMHPEELAAVAASAVTAGLPISTWARRELQIAAGVPLEVVDAREAAREEHHQVQLAAARIEAARWKMCRRRKVTEGGVS